MGILDAIRGKVNQLDKTYNPLRKVADAMGDSVAKASATAGKPPQAGIEVKNTPTGELKKKGF